MPCNNQRLSKGILFLLFLILQTLIKGITLILSINVKLQDIKAFYMRQNDDGKTVAAMDLLVPRVMCVYIYIYIILF